MSAIDLRDDLLESIRGSRWKFLDAAAGWAKDWEGAGPWPAIYAELVDRFTDTFLLGRTLPEVKADPELRALLDREVFDWADLHLQRALRPLKRWHLTRHIALEGLRRAKVMAGEVFEPSDDLVDGMGLASAARSLGESVFEGSDWRNAVSTGIPRLDSVLNGGMPRGELTLLGAGTGGGKSLLALILAETAARRHGAVVVSSPEMPAGSLGMRLAQRLARVSRAQIHERDSDAYERFVAATRQIEALPLHLLDKGDVNVFDVVKVAQRVNREQPVHLLVLDYAQQLAPQEASDKARYLEVAKVATEAIKFAAEAGCAVLVTSQLNEAKDKGGRVTSISFRESAITEHKAAVSAVLSLDKRKRTGELVLRKNRHGPTAAIPLAYTPEWYDLEEGVEV